jgi:hypothetical protein
MRRSRAVCRRFVWARTDWVSLCSHAHANRSPPHVPGDAIRDGQFRPVAGESAERPPAGQEKTFAFHQDSGRVNKELETSDGIVPRLSVKAIACERPHSAHSGCLLTSQLSAHWNCNAHPLMLQW